jgi:acyl carrier protein
MTKVEFYSELEEILEIKPGTIQGKETLREMHGWDSMAVLSIIAMVDEKLGEVVSPSALAECKTVLDLANLFPGKII